MADFSIVPAPFSENMSLTTDTAQMTFDGSTANSATHL